MKKVAIIVPETAVIEAVADPRYLLLAVNQFLSQAGQQPLFEVQLVGQSKEVKVANGVFSIHTDAVISEAQRPDLIIIPALSGNLSDAISLNQSFLPWIRKNYQEGTEVASLCLGAFLLASTGLLNGKSCSTHWLFANDFRTMFPEVTLMDNRIITEQNGLYSSGGANSYWNLLLHLVEKYSSRELAVLASKFFVLDINRKSQSSFSIFHGQKMHDDSAIKLVQEFIEEHFEKRITIEELAAQHNLGRRTFERRFKKATNNSVIEYVQRVRIEAAKKALESGRKTITEVMFDVGYSDTKAFRDVFKKITGLSPTDYKQRYEKIGIE